MKLETVIIESLSLDPNNARKHSKRNLDAIAASLNKFGQRKPIVVHQNTVIAGNGTLEAAKTLGWTEISISRCPADWDTDTAKAYALADNRSAELAEWDDAILATQLLDLDEMGWDIEDIGFSQKDLPDLNPVDEDEIPEPPVEPKTKLGDIYQLGRHRLMCGDSTDLASVGHLMNGVKADLVFTDPPYGVEYQSNMRTKSEKFAVLSNDDKFLDITPAIKEYSNGWIFVWTSWKVQNKWIDLLKDFDYPTNIIVWHKPGGGIGDLKRTFLSDYKIALVWHRGAELCGKRIGSVWTINKDGASTYLHPTQKPVELSREALDKTTNANANVLDLFGGSGSTLIGCELMNRNAYLMELDPKYCDVIIKRWENLTGLEAELIS
jgi:DNA modification methylase